MAKRHPQDSLPLKIDTRVEVHPETGATIDITRYTRGIRSVEERKYEDLPSLMLDGCPARERLERVRDGLRKQLQRQGYPTDLTPVWVKREDASKPWNGEKLEDQYPVSLRRWTAMIEADTDPLMIARASAEYLDALVRVLEAEGIERYLELIATFVGTGTHYHLLLQNNLAYCGLETTRKLQEGPKTLKRRSAAVRDVILKHANAYWDKHPNSRNQVGNTAEIIADSVNHELNEKRYLLKGGRRCSVRVIKGHIRDSLNNVI